MMYSLTFVCTFFGEEVVTLIASSTKALYYILFHIESPNTAVVASDMVIVVEGESVTISCNSSGAPAPSITWTLNSQNPPFNQTDVVTEATATLVSSNSSDPTSPSAPNVTEGSVVSTLHIDGALYPDHDGVYQCSGSNSMAASTNTSSVNITVQVHGRSTTVWGAVTN